MELGSSDETRSDGDSDYTLITNEKCSPPRAKLFLVAIISFVLASLVVLLVILTRIDQKTSAKHEDSENGGCWFSDICFNGNESETCADWAIVGAGLAGTYAAWRLHQMDPSYTIVLYEASERLGGRLLTASFPNISQRLHIELGATYFLPELHPLMNQTAHALGLETRPLMEGFLASEALYHLRGKSFRAAQLNSSEVPYNLDSTEQNYFPYDLYRAFLDGHLLWPPDAGLDPYVATNDSEPVEDMYYHQHSLRHFLGEFASQEASMFMQDAVDPRDFHTAAHAGVFQESVQRLDIRAPLDNMAHRMTLVKGMDELPRTLLQQTVTNRITLKTNHSLIKVDKEDNTHRLFFTLTDSDETFPSSCAKSVILALPPHGLDPLAWSHYHFPSWFPQHLHSLLEVKVSRLVLAYQEPWWLHSQLPWRSAHTDLPISQVDYLQPAAGDTTSNNTDVNQNDLDEMLHVLSVSVTKDAHIEYWKSLLREEELSSGPLTELEVTSQVVKHVTKHMTRLAVQYGDLSSNTTVPDPQWAIMHQWSHDNNTQPAWYLWKPYTDWSEVSSQMIQPVPGESLYIVGSAFAPGDMQLWAEGALWSVNTLFEQHLTD